VISDYYETPETIVRTMEPLAFRGAEVVLFHILDPQEIEPRFGEPVLLVDLETRDDLEVSPEYARTEYRRKIAGHIEELRDRAQRARMDYYLLRTDRPLDEALREYLSIREGRY
jgi:hypothetical protein